MEKISPTINFCQNTKQKFFYLPPKSVFLFLHKALGVFRNISSQEIIKFLLVI